MMDRDGGNQLRLTDYPGVDQFPEWSPNGKITPTVYAFMWGAVRLVG